MASSRDTTYTEVLTGCARTKVWFGTMTTAPGTERFTYLYVVTLIVYTFTTVTWLMFTFRS